MKKILKIIFIFILILLIINIIDIFLIQSVKFNKISINNKVNIYDSNEEIIYTLNNSKESTYINLDEISDITKEVFVQIEDKRFYLHNGVDFITTIQAIKHNFTSDYKIGGSTITQQYAKNLFLSNEKTYTRKIKEYYYSFRLEHLYTKNEILEGYLNTIYFNNGIYGIFDASKYYFNKHPNDLTLRESLALVSIIKSPSNYCLINNYDANHTRSMYLLESLYDRSIISTIEYNKAKTTTLIINQTQENKYSNSILYFKDYIFKKIDTMQDIEIYTKFDTKLNLYIDSLISNVDCDVSVVVLDNQGNIISLIGNKEYYTSTYNIATNASRMIGSTIKPLLYYEALNYGMKQSDTFMSEKKDFIIDNEIVSISNYNDSYDNKQINMTYASATSDNIYAFKTHLFIGIDKLPSLLKKFDIEPINDKYTISLGTQDTSLLTLTNIYNTFHNNGIYTIPIPYYKYISNNTTFNNLSLKSQLLDKELCISINELLKATFDTSLNDTNNVTGNSIAHLLNKEASGKSGLTDYDSYMIGSTESYTIGIWAGHSDNSLLTDNKNKKLPKELFYKIVNYL